MIDARPGPASIGKGFTLPHTLCCPAARQAAAWHGTHRVKYLKIVTALRRLAVRLVLSKAAARKSASFGHFRQGGAESRANWALAGRQAGSARK